MLPHVEIKDKRLGQEVINDNLGSLYVGCGLKVKSHGLLALLDLNLLTDWSLG